MPALKCEGSAEPRRSQTGQGSKILNPNQILSRLTITVAQLKAGNNSKKLNNVIRQLLYSLYRSENEPKQSISISSILFRNGNSLYEHWKQ